MLPNSSFKPLLHRRRQRRPRKRLDIGLEMLRIARTGQNDIDSRLVTAKPVGRVLNRNRRAIIGNEIQRLCEIHRAGRNRACADKLGAKFFQPLGLA